MDRRCQAGQDRDCTFIITIIFSFFFLAAVCRLVGLFIILAVFCYSVIIKLSLINIISHCILIYNIINTVNWASLVAQLVKHPPVMQEISV